MLNMKMKDLIKRKLRIISVIKFTALIVLLSLISCVSKVKTIDKDKDIYEIINSELKRLYPKSNGESVFLRKELRNKIIDLDDLAFDEQVVRVSLFNDFLFFIQRRISIFV